MLLHRLSWCESHMNRAQPALARSQSSRPSSATNTRFPGGTDNCSANAANTVVRPPTGRMHGFPRTHPCRYAFGCATSGQEAWSHRSNRTDVAARSSKAPPPPPVSRRGSPAVSGEHLRTSRPPATRPQRFVPLSTNHGSRRINRCSWPTHPPRCDGALVRSNRSPRHPHRRGR